MTAEKAEQMLAQYQRCVGRCGYLETAISEMEADISEWSNALAEEMAEPGGQRMDGMPHGSTVGRPTEQIAIMLAGGYTPDDLQAAKHTLNEMKKELREKLMVITFVEAWMTGLTTKERWIITQLYFEGATYNETARAYAEQYGQQVSRDGIRRMRKNIVLKIAEMAK